MTNMAWLAALLSPRSVSPHPNFRSVDTVTPPGLFGLVITGSEHDIPSALERLPRPLATVEADLVDAAQAAIHLETMADGAARLRQIALGTHKDAAFRTAAALLAAVSLAELERLEEAVALLANTARSVNGRTDDAHLLQGALKQQEALRAIELNVAWRTQRDTARDLFAKVDGARIGKYPTSQGAKWGAVATNRNILKALREANQDLYDAEVVFPDSRNLKRLLRGATPLTTQNMLHASTGYASYVAEQFKTFTRNEDHTFRSQDPVDQPVWRAQMYFELLGHRGQSRAKRNTLGQLRFMRGAQLGSPLAHEDGIRLLRQSGALKELSLALTTLRARGPLDALHSQLHAIVEHRLTPTRLRPADLVTLEFGAQVLDTDTARRVLTELLAAVDASPIPMAFSRELPSNQIERLMKAAAAVAPVAEQTDLLAERVLTSVQRIGPIEDELLARAHVKGIWNIDWSEVAEPIRSQWRMWFTDPFAVEGWTSLVEAVRPELREVEPTVETDAADLTLGNLGHELNHAIADPAQPLNWLRHQGEELVRTHLVDVQSQYANGMYTTYSFDAADIGVALIHLAQADLWEPITEFLVNPRVPRSAKTPALNRVASRPELVPENAWARLVEAKGVLLEKTSLPSPFEEEIEPYPAAVKLYTSLDAFTTAEQLASVTVLAVGSPQARLEACRILTTVLSNAGRPPDWVVATVVQLSIDHDENVRAETGRALAMALRATEFGRELLQLRLQALLAEDGMLVPLLVLRGLSDELPPPTGLISEQVAAIASEHPVFGVRVQARYALRERV